MATTVEEIKKQVSDANTAAAVAALEAQVEKTRASYANMNRDVNAAVREGSGNIQNRMERAGLDRPVTETAGLIMNTAAGEARVSNQKAQQLGETGMQNNIRYLASAGQEQADKLKKQQAQQKAEVLAQYGDFSGYGELGYTPAQVQSMKAAYDAENNRPEDYEGMGSYAETLLNLYAGNANFNIEEGLQQALQNGLITERDYQAAMIASRGVVPGSKGKKAGKGTDNDSNATAAEQAAAKRITQQTPDGKYIVTDPGDWQTLMGYYNRNGQLSQFAQQFVFEPQNDADGVYVPGYGEISWEEADALEQQGAIIVTGKDANGKPVFAPAGTAGSSFRAKR